MRISGRLETRMTCVLIKGEDGIQGQERTDRRGVETQWSTTWGWGWDGAAVNHGTAQTAGEPTKLGEARKDPSLELSEGPHTLLLDFLPPEL